MKRRREVAAPVVAASSSDGAESGSEFDDFGRPLTRRRPPSAPHADDESTHSSQEPESGSSESLKNALVGAEDGSDTWAGVEVVDATVGGLEFATPRAPLRKAPRRTRLSSSPSTAVAFSGRRRRRPRHRRLTAATSPVYVSNRPASLGVPARYWWRLWKGASADRNHNVLVAGHLHHGKTAVVDQFLDTFAAAPAVSVSPWRRGTGRVTDTRRDELSRGISLHAAVASRAVTADGITHLVHWVDAPGHADFFDQTVAASFLCEAALLVVDCCEGVMLGTERAVALCASRRLPMTLVLSKVDRLVLEMRLPPADAYAKLAQVIADANRLAKQYPLNASTAGDDYFVPVGRRANVVFSSARYGMLFTLADVARQWYAKGAPRGMPRAQMPESTSSPRWCFFRARHLRQRRPLPSPTLADVLWGRQAWDRATGTIAAASPHELGLALKKRTAVELVLEPLYKVVALCALTGTDAARLPTLAEALRQFGGACTERNALIAALEQAARAGADTLLRTACRYLFQTHTDIARMLTAHPSRAVLDGGIASEAAPEAEVLVTGHVLHPAGDTTMAVALVLRGRLRRGDTLRAANAAAASWTLTDALVVPNGRVLYATEEAPAGRLVYLPGVVPADSHPDARTFTLYTGASAPSTDASGALQRALRRHGQPTLGMAVAPLRPRRPPPSEALLEVQQERGTAPVRFAQVMQAVRVLARTYPALQIVPQRCEFAAELAPAAAAVVVVVGTGELYLDAFLYDLRRYLVAQTGAHTWWNVRTARVPFVVRWREGITRPSAGVDVEEDTSDVGERCRVRLQMRAEPMARARTDASAAERWELQWACADAPWREAVEAGVRQAAAAGPLLQAPVYRVRWVVQQVAVAAEEGKVAESMMHRPSATAAMTAAVREASRRAALQAVLHARPCLYEPVYRVQIATRTEHVPTVCRLLTERRRGRVLRVRRPLGWPFAVVEARMPAQEMVPGMETEVRYLTHGAAWVQCACDEAVDETAETGWARVPGDLPGDVHDGVEPSGSSRPVGSASATAAADILHKTRARRGLPASVR